MKRKRISNSSNESTSSNSRSIKHYFNNATTTEKTSTMAIVDPFERNLERAIKQSLLENNSNVDEVTNNPGTQSAVVNNTANFTQAESIVSSPTTTYLDGHQQQLADSLNQCPICDVLLDKKVDPNRHINNCLDTFERSDSSKERKGNIKPEAAAGLAAETQDRAGVSSSTAPQELRNTPASGPYESIIDKETPNNNNRKKASSPRNKAKRKCPFYKWIQGKRKKGIYALCC